jgi:predicted transcriptional regulator
MTTQSFLVRLSEDEHEQLKQLAESEHRSMQDVARLAISERAARVGRRAAVRSELSKIMDRDAELLNRLA